MSRGAPGHEAKTLPQINPEQIPADIKLIVPFGSIGVWRPPALCSSLRWCAVQHQAIDPSRVYAAIPVVLDDLRQLKQAVATQVRI